MKKQYEIILCDPPWSFKVWNDETGSEKSAPYKTMTTEDICALPVLDVCANNCALFLWAIWPKIFDAKEVIEAWGFEYKTLAWTWVKLNPSGLGFHMGLGYYTRANPEPCLLAVRGKMPVETKSERNLLISPVSRHSEKPLEQYRKIDRLYPNHSRRLEMFARKQHEGWDVFGDEVENSIAIGGNNV